jgi:lipase chaperone LimK
LAQGERVQRLRLEASRIKQKAGLSTERAALKAEAVQPARPLSPSTASVL